MRFCSPDNFSLVRIGDKTTCVPESNTITLCNPSWYCSDYSWLCPWCPCETAAVGNSGLCEAWESLGDVADMSSKQHSSQGCVGSAHACLCTSHKRVPAAVTHPVLVVALAVTHGADGAAWLSSSTPPDAMGLFSLQSSEEVLQGHTRLQGKFLSPAGSCCCKLPFFCIPLCSVCAGGGAVGWLAMGCGSTAD